MSDTSYSLKQCPNCGVACYMPATLVVSDSKPCPSCGVVPVPSLPGGQMQLLAATSAPGTTGPLLTGNARWDRTLGQAGEIMGLALLLYAFFVYFRALFWHDSLFLPTLLTVLGTVATAWCLFKYADTMRQRYPSFASGWQAGRDSWGKVVEHIITLLFGVGVFVVFAPVTGILVDLARQNGVIVWLLIAAVAYALGWIVRRIGSPWKGNTTS